MLIAGAGPVGLFLANECARRGLRSRIVEARPSQSLYSKAWQSSPGRSRYSTWREWSLRFSKEANPVTSAYSAHNGDDTAALKSYVRS
ncbi:MAG: FAD-dependent monooxygenase [Acidobacteriaceae bacterium]|nr:FAD-dependent monooxygenase [Acidobacteriaceae bacterium]